MLSSKLEMHMNEGLQKLSRDCTQQLLPFCSAVYAKCTLEYEERIGTLLLDFNKDVNKLVRADGSTPVELIMEFVITSVARVSQPYRTAYKYLMKMTIFTSSVPSIQPFGIENLILHITKRDSEKVMLKEYITIQTEELLTWGIVRSKSGDSDHPCSHYRNYQRESELYSKFLHRCNYVNVYQSNIDLIRCAYTDFASTTLVWSTVSSAYFHSQCLCLAYNGTNCGVRAPQGIDPRLYCLSVLLRDFQRQVSYRPAVTYLDYVFKTRVPICRFTNFLQLGFQNLCNGSDLGSNFQSVLSVQCYFKGLVNKQLNCSEALLANTYSATELCAIQRFMNWVICDDDDGDLKVTVPIYAVGASATELALTYVDVAARVLTLVTYLACPQLHNLPGKLQMGYQVTALLRLLVVHTGIEDFALAVRLDVALDLASTLWLTAYLHFLTNSIRTLRLPDSLSRDEVRTVLVRYTMLGWALPVVLSVAFFWMDEAIDSHVQFGQLLLVLCNYAALSWNLYMFFENCNFYYDVKSSALPFKSGAKARSVFTGLFNFALKTSVLSGVGIIFRLVFTQIQGLGHVLSIYHALGTIQGLLLFVLYGCNREARDFWLLVATRTFSRCLHRQNNSS